jgi:hypothetical protein
MTKTLIEKPPVPRSSDGKSFFRLQLRGVGTESTDRPSRIRDPIAAVTTYEDEMVDCGQSPSHEPEQALQPGSVVTTLIERACELGKLNKGWNSYSAPAPTSAAIGKAKTLLTRASVAGIVPERIEPSAMGGVGVTFAAGSREVAVEFYNAGNVHALFSDSETESLDTAPVALGVEGYDRLLQQVRRYLYGQNAAAPQPKLPRR